MDESNIIKAIKYLEKVIDTLEEGDIDNIDIFDTLNEIIEELESIET